MHKPKRPCKEIGCNKLTRESWCDVHKKNVQEIHQEYNRYKRDGKANAFYQSREWKHIRKLALERDNFLCQMCLRDGNLVKGVIVHHLEEIKDNWNRRLDLSNLEVVCRNCHNRIHKATPPGVKNTIF